MRYLTNQKGATLMESLFGLLFLAIASTIFVTVMLNFMYQKELQKDDLVMINMTTKYVEETYNGLLTDSLTELPYTNTLIEKHGDLEYTVSIKVEPKQQTYNTHWTTGLIYEITVEATNGLKTKVVSTYAFKE